ncbi:MAG: glycoside hydrolase family 10 protein [Elainella sp.]
MATLRGVWLTNVDSSILNSKHQIREAMQLLADTGFNYLFPVVWNKGYTLYPSPTLRKLIGVEIAPAFQGRDPLAEVVEAAHAFGLKVIPWFEYGFAASYGHPGPILQARPDWAAQDQQGKLLNKNGFNWLNALHPDVQTFLLDLILEVVQTYDVDGIQGDDRLPALPSEGGYDDYTQQLYRREFGAPPAHCKQQAWLQWRADRLTEFLARLRKAVKTVNPELLISMAPSPYPFGFTEYLQDVPAWLQQGLVDLLHPQLYRRDLRAYRGLVNELINQFPAHLPIIAPGVLTKFGSYTISPDLLWDCIQVNRRSGLGGEVLFFYEGLRINDRAIAKRLQARGYAKLR